ncbi:hypothetical protein INT45_010156 [Circinella minor]|uniref:Uncharacterized protein n=1 Tax=Circinella minor TaxID=1195481 RepID=A0A8H7SCN9_9FUNG|nr:hypothetical protein INT45_010156 [Circinella minor]
MVCPEFLSDVISDDNVIQTNDQNNENQVSEPKQPPNTAKETRREKEFLQRISHFSSVLGVSTWTHDVQRLYYTYRSALVPYRRRFSTEAAVSLIFIGTRVQKPGSTLSDYGSIIGITDVRALNSSFKRLSNIIKTSCTPALSPSSRMDTIPLPLKDISINEIEARISTIIIKILDPISIIFSLPETRILDLKYWTVRVYDVAVQAELQTGRHMDPLITACVVVGASVIGQNVTIQMKDWKLLGKHISYGFTTIQARYAEILKIMKQIAKKIPWTSQMTMAKLKASHYLGEIIELGANHNIDTEDQQGHKQQQTFSAERHPPAYLQNQAFIQRRTKQINIALKYFVKPSSSIMIKTDLMSSELLSMDPEIRMIYLLLAKNVPTSEIEGMSSHRIYEQVYRLYLQKDSKLSAEELNSSELTEKDMDDRELAQYVKN